MTLSLLDAARAIGARCEGRDVVFRGLSTDTRTIEKDNLFVALKGPNFDAHDYVDQAAGKGAAALTVSRPVGAELPQLRVADTRLALGQLAAYWRRKIDLPLVAVTGSNGKTTVKEMMAAILECRGPVLATRGNFNNDIGVPLTLTRLGMEHRYAVIEMGANHPGEIEYLAGLAQPDVAVITNVAAAHLAGFGSIEGIAAAKGEIFQSLSESGTAVINAEDRFAAYWRDRCGHCQVVDFAMDCSASIQGDWTPKDEGAQLRIRSGYGEADIQLSLPGRHNAMNALAAAAATLVMGASIEDVRSGLEAMQAVPGRLQRLVGKDGVCLIDDTYNANPGSISAALHVLAETESETWLVLGDMGELGDHADELHYEAGELARELGINRVYTVGELAAHAVKGFGVDGESFANQDALIKRVSEKLAPAVTILVKGSRAMQMERVVAALTVPGNPNEREG